MTTLERMFAYSGVQKYHAKGLKGKGIRVVNCETTKGEHGAKTTEVLRMVAPEAEILNCSVSTTVGSRGASLSFVYEGVAYSPEEFYEAVKPDIMTASLAGKKPQPTLAALIQPLLDQGVIFFNCIGNTMDDANYGFFIDYALNIGAAGWQNEDYSQVVVRGYSMPDPDFVAFEGDKYHGTSFSTPFAAGMAALVLQNRCKMDQIELELLFDEYAETIDTYSKCGNGLLIMPPLLEEDQQKGEEYMFKDIEPDRWSFKDIEWCVNKGYLKGFPDETFRPEEPITREQLAVVLKRLETK